MRVWLWCVRCGSRTPDRGDRGYDEAPDHLSEVRGLRGLFFRVGELSTFNVGAANGNATITSRAGVSRLVGLWHNRRRYA